MGVDRCRPGRPRGNACKMVDRSEQAASIQVLCNINMASTSGGTPATMSRGLRAEYLRPLSCRRSRSWTIARCFNGRASRDERTPKTRTSSDLLLPLTAHRRQGAALAQCPFVPRRVLIRLDRDLIWKGGACEHVPAWCDSRSGPPREPVWIPDARAVSAEWSEGQPRQVWVRSSGSRTMQCHDNDRHQGAPAVGHKLTHRAPACLLLCCGLSRCMRRQHLRSMREPHRAGLPVAVVLGFISSLSTGGGDLVEVIEIRSSLGASPRRMTLRLALYARHRGTFRTIRPTQRRARQLEEALQRDA